MAMTDGTAVLVSSGTPPGWPGPVSLYVYYKVLSQDLAKNQTTLSLGMYVTTPNKWDIGGWTDYNGSYIGIAASGDGCITFDGSIPNFYGTRWLIENQEITVDHNADGTKTVSIHWKWGVNSGWSGVMVHPSGYFEVTLDTIPRASTIGATDSNIGSVSMIAVTRKSSAYTHSVMFQFGAVTGYITEDGGVSASEVKISALSIPFKVPDSFYGQIPNAKSGVCTLTCKTYSGSAQVGDAQTATFIATAAEALCAPVVSGSVVDSNAATVALTGDASKLVRFMSTALCTISAAAQNSASISQKSIAGAVISGDSRSIQAVETGSILFRAVDSRGYSTNFTATPDLIPYIKLTNNAVANRSDPTSGNAVLSLKGACFCGNFGAADNVVTAQYSVNGGTPVNVTPAMADGAYSLDIPLTGLDYTKQHSIAVTVSDKLTSIQKTIILKRGIPVFDWGENDFAFNVPVYLNAVSYDADTGKLTIS